MRISFSPSSLVALALLAGAAPVGAAEPSSDDAPNPGLFGTTVLEGWTRNVSLGVAGSQGNSFEG